MTDLEIRHMTCPIDLDLIKPDALGKYSPFLYRWFKNKGKGFGYGVFHLEKNHPFDGRFDLANLFAGFLDGYGLVTVNGHPFGHILSGNRAHPFGLICSTEPLDVTAAFWAGYLAKGRCLLDPSHKMAWRGDKDRFLSINETQRRCQWCGVVQTLETRKITKVHKVWEAVA